MPVAQAWRSEKAWLFGEFQVTLAEIKGGGEAWVGGKEQEGWWGGSRRDDGAWVGKDTGHQVRSVDGVFEGALAPRLQEVGWLREKPSFADGHAPCLSSLFFRLGLHVRWHSGEIRHLSVLCRCLVHSAG